MSSSSSQGISKDLSPQNCSSFAHRAGLKSFSFSLLFLKECDLGDQKKSIVWKENKSWGLRCQHRGTAGWHRQALERIGKMCETKRGQRPVDSRAARIHFLLPHVPQEVPGPQREMPLCSVLEIRPPYKAPGLSKGLMCPLAQRQWSFKGLWGLKKWTCLCKLKTKGCPANILHFLRKA